jgi:uncharacterized phiE125 gp8 family phage protein
MKKPKSILPQNDVSLELISLDEARLHLRLDALGSPPSHPDDALIESLITAVREDAENYMGTAVVQQTYSAAYDGFDDQALELGIWPVTGVVSVVYTDVNGIPQTLSYSKYILDNYEKPARLFPKETWPQTASTPNSVIVTFSAGHTDGDSPNPYPLPKAIRAAMLLMLGHLYENREAVAYANQVVTLPLGAIHLMTPYRIKMGM